MGKIESAMKGDYMRKGMKEKYDIATLKSMGFDTYFNDLKFAEEHREEFSTNFLEFSKEPIESINPWREDSIYIYGEMFDVLGYNQLFRNVIPNFDFYGNTLVTAEDWNVLLQKSRTMSQEVIEAFDELKKWVDECFKEQDWFVARGV